MSLEELEYDEDGDPIYRIDFPKREDLTFFVYYDEYDGILECNASFDLKDQYGDYWDQSSKEYIEEHYGLDLSKLDEIAENYFTFDGSFLNPTNPAYSYKTKEEFAQMFEKVSGVKFSGVFEVP